GPVAEGAPPPGTGDPARVARVPSASGHSRKSVLVDLWYQLTPNQLGASNSFWTRTFGSLQTVLISPRLCEHPGRGSVRWQVVLPADWVPLSDDGTLPADLAWGWRGWLVGTRPSASANELEQWLTASEDRAALEESDAPHASVVSWRTDLGALTI